MSLIPAPVINPTLDLSKATASVPLYAAEIMRKRFGNLDAARQFMTHMDVTKSKKFRKIVVNGSLRKYDGAVKTGNNAIALSDRELSVKVGQKELPVEGEAFRDTWANQMAKISEGRVPMEEYILDDFIKNSFVDLDKIFWKGDTTLPANAGLPEEICDGLEKILLGLTTGATPEIVPVSVPVFNEGSGSNLNAVGGNYNDNMFKVWNAHVDAVKKEPVDMFLSYGNYAAAARSYRREFGNEATFNKDDYNQEFFYLDNTQKKCRVFPASWLGTSNRIVSCKYGAIVTGTDLAQMVTSVDIQKNGYIFLYLMKVVFGVQVVDPEAVRISSQA